MAATYRGDSPTSQDAHESSADAASTGSNRREHVRVRPDETNRLTATLASGADIRLIDLSRGGAQFECDRRFLPNATVSLRLLTSDGQVLVTGRVVRSRIVRLVSGGLGYLVGVAFSKPLESGVGAVAQTPAPDVAARTAPVEAASTVRSFEPVEATSADDVVVTPADVVAGIDVLADVTPTEVQADISAEEALAFESTIELAPAMLTVTASVDSTSEQLHDMFNGNDW